MTIRPFQDGDLVDYLRMAGVFYASDATITQVDPKQFIRTYEKTLEQSPFVKGLMLLEEDGRPVGYCIVTYGWYNEFGGMVVTIEELYLEEDCRSKGYGSQVLEWIRQEHRKDFIALKLEVCRKNPRAMALYERLGYQPLDYLQMYLPLQEA